MEDLKFFIQKTKLRFILNMAGHKEIVVPEYVTEITGFGSIKENGTKIYLPDGIQSIVHYAPFPRNLEPLFVLMVRPGTLTEETVRKNGWPYEVIGDEPADDPLPAPPEFHMCGTVLAAYTGQEKEVVIPQGVTEIGAFALMNDQSLESLVLPEGVEKIHSGAFAQCFHLKRLSLPESLREIGAFAFIHCRSLESGCIRLSEAWTYLGPFCFAYTGLQFESVPSSLIPRIGWCALTRCSVHAPVDVPSEIGEIPDGAFMMCQLQGNVVMHEGLKKIGDCSFGEAGLESIVLPEGLETLGRDALSYNPFQTLKLPQSLRGDVVLSLPFVRELVIPEGVTGLGVNDSRKLERIKLPNTLETLLNFGFEWCESLTHVRIPDGVRSIPSNCFHGCYALKRIELPSSIDFFETSPLKTEYGSPISALVAAPEGSYALEYAKKEGVRWEAIDACKQKSF